jgi:hypothetical protein
MPVRTQFAFISFHRVLLKPIDDMTIIMVMERGSKRSFALVYDAEVAEHLGRIERKYHSFIRHAIERQLGHEPERETRNRKPLARPTQVGATWELRCGPGNRCRVFYEIDLTAREVHILAIGIKQGNRLRIGGEEFEP